MSLTKVTYSMIAGSPVNVDDFGADPTGVSDSTAAIQDAIDYACSLVTNDTTGDPINGANVVFKGVYKISDTLRVTNGNVNLIGQGGATIKPYFTAATKAAGGYNGWQPVFIIGTAEEWQTGGMSSTYKYNRIEGFLIKRVSGVDYIGACGVLVSGTRNATVRDLLVENHGVAVYLENTSEFYGEEISAIGCDFGFVLDSRNSRAAAYSILNESCTTQDVSSNVFNMITAYYPQTTGFLAMNCGTTSVNGMTVGQFSSNPSTPPLGLSPGPAGIEIAGGNTGSLNFTRGMLFNDVVFEAIGNHDSSCIYLSANQTDAPVTGVTFNNCVVQTYASDHAGGIVTTLLQTYAGSGCEGNYVKMSNCGFIPQSSGYYYGNMVENFGNGSFIVKFDNCYPNVAYASSNNLGLNTQIADLELIERVDIDAFPPTGWSSTGTISGCSKQGGSSGAPAKLTFTGSTGEITIDKSFTYVNYVYDNAAAFISMIVSGDADLACWCRVNGVSQTDSNVIDNNTETYYSNALYLPKEANGFRRVIFCFQPFSANYDFNTVTYHIGKAAGASSSTYTDISNILVGYFKGGPTPYNPF